MAVGLGVGSSGVAVAVAVGVGVGVGSSGVVVELAVGVGLGVGADNPGLVTLFVSSVTAVVTDKRRPNTVLPLTTVIAVLARMFPIKLLPAPSVAAVPTWK